MQLEWTDCGFGAATTAELDSIMLSRGGLFGHLGAYGTTCPQEIAQRADDWSARWVGTKGEGNRGQLVLVPLSPRTRRLHRRGTQEEWVRRGLTRSQAATLWRTRVRHKHEILDKLVEVMLDEELTEAFRQHPGWYGPGSGRREWLMRFQHLEVLDKMSAQREAALAQMVQAIA